MPKPGTLDQDQSLGSEPESALSRLIRPNPDAATWICPDCGQPVPPHAMGTLMGAPGFMPRAWCSCPGALARREQVIRLRVANSERDREQKERVQLLEACGLAARQCAGMAFETWRQDTPARRTAYALARKAIPRLLAGVGILDRAIWLWQDPSGLCHLSIYRA